MDYPDSDDLYEGKFTDGDPVAGIPASIASADHMNAVYDELSAAITAGGLTPDVDDKTQLAQSISNQVQSAQNLVQYAVYKDPLNYGIEQVVGGDIPFFTSLEIEFTPKFSDSTIVIKAGGSFRVIRTDGGVGVCGMDIQLYDATELLDGKFGFVYSSYSSNIHHHPNMLHLDTRESLDVRNYKIALYQHTTGCSLSYFPSFGRGFISVEEYQNV